MAQNTQPPRNAAPIITTVPKDISEKYHRPSKHLPLKNPFSYQLFAANDSDYVFKTPTDVIYAYYGIVKEASNMEGFAGGCGTIGFAKAPYEIAYRLLDRDIRKHIELDQFIQTFEGVGHITLLKLHLLPKDSTSETIRHYMVEVELITGPKINEDDETPPNPITYFAYYYGIITVIKNEIGWHIQRIKYYPEDFLCAPYHSWFYDSNAIVKIIYTEDLKLIQSVSKITETGDIISYYCTDGQHQYRLDFVVLVNGHEILINESILLQNGTYKNIDFIGDGWEHLKLNPDEDKK